MATSWSKAKRDFDAKRQEPRWRRINIAGRFAARASSAAAQSATEPVSASLKLGRAALQLLQDVQGEVEQTKADVLAAERFVSKQRAAPQSAAAARELGQVDGHRDALSGERAAAERQAFLNGYRASLEPGWRTEDPGLTDEDFCAGYAAGLERARVATVLGDDYAAACIAAATATAPPKIAASGSPPWSQAAGDLKRPNSRTLGAKMNQLSADVEELERALISLRAIQEAVQDQQQAALGAAEGVAQAWTDARGQDIANEYRTGAQAQCHVA
jgi:outer membrane murein-binding lipoprotein Lpp